MRNAKLEGQKICFIRCMQAIGIGVCVQFVLLQIFLLLVNFHPLHPIRWIASSFKVMFTFRTWVFTIPLLAIVFVYGIVAAKPFIAARKYYPSRFRWLLGTVWWKFTSLTAHVLLSLVTAWLYTRFLRFDYGTLILQCYDNDCLNSRYVFLLSAATAAGCYHFTKENLREEPRLKLPIVHELKLNRVKWVLYSTLYKSLPNALSPFLIFTIVYWLFGGLINRRFAGVFMVEVDFGLESLLDIILDLRLLFYGWILTAHILSNMQLMQDFLSVSLSQKLYFPISRCTDLAEESKIILVEALAMVHVPVIHSLAALDLLNLSQENAGERRKEIFALSVPGGHPYNWRELSGQCLSLINGFTNSLKDSIAYIPPAINPTEMFARPTWATDAAERLLKRQYNDINGIRRMYEPEPPCVVEQRLTVYYVCQCIANRVEEFGRQVEETLRSVFRRIPGLVYLFAESDGARTAFLLAYSENVKRIMLGFARICAFSLTEDKYGVVQVELPFIITALLELKLELEKLNNLNGKNCDYNLKGLLQTVKRSLYVICTSFGDYLQDVVEDEGDLRQLNYFLNFQES